MAEKTVSFKMPEDEVRELDQEADENGKSRSAYIRSLLRSRHIEEKLDEQVLTKQDQREYEQRIQELEEQRDALKIKAAKADTVESTIDDAVDRSLKTVQQNYEDQIEQLQAENEQLRASLENLSENVVTESDLDDLKTEIERSIENWSNSLLRSITNERKKANSHMDTCKDEIMEKVQHARPPATKVADWLRSLSHRVKIYRSRRKIK